MVISSVLPDHILNQYMNFTSKILSGCADIRFLKSRVISMKPGNCGSVLSCVHTDIESSLVYIPISISHCRIKT